jgi:hypothetical protein
VTPRRLTAVFHPFGLVEGVRFQEYLYVAHAMFVPGVT